MTPERTIESEEQGALAAEKTAAPLFTKADKAKLELQSRMTLERELLSKSFEFESTPYEAHIQFSNFCNMSCIMCWNGKNPKTQKLSEELIARVAEQIGPHVSLIQPYDGSEPLIFTWEETRDLALEYGIEMTITTNVQFLDEEKFEELKDVTQTLCLSIDTHIPEIFKRIRLRSNADKVYRNFEATAQRCREHNLECVVNVVLMMENIALMPETLGYFADHGYDHVNVMQMLDINNESNFHDPLAHYSEEFMLWIKLQCIEVCRKRKMRMLWNVGTLEIVDFRDDPILPDPRKRANDHFDWRMQHYLPGFCRHAQNRLRIEFDGNVSPCCYATQGQLSLGNLNQEDFAEIWNGPNAKDLRRSMYCEDLPSLCVNCRIRTPVGMEENLLFTEKVMNALEPEFFHELELEEGETEERTIQILSPDHLFRTTQPPTIELISLYKAPQLLLAVSLGGENEEIFTEHLMVEFDDDFQTSFEFPRRIFEKMETNLGYWFTVWQQPEDGLPPVRSEFIRCLISHEHLDRLAGSSLDYDDQGASALYELGADRSIGFKRVQ